MKGCREQGFVLAARAQAFGCRGSMSKLDTGHCLGKYCVQGLVGRIGKNERQV